MSNGRRDGFGAGSTADSDVAHVEGPSDRDRAAAEAVHTEGRVRIAVVEPDERLADRYASWLAGVEDAVVPSGASKPGRGAPNAEVVVGSPAAIDESLDGTPEALRERSPESEVLVLGLRQGGSRSVEPPADREAVRDAVERVVRYERYDRLVREYLALVAEPNSDATRVDGSGTRVGEQLSECLEELDALAASFDDDDVAQVIGGADP